MAYPTQEIIDLGMGAGTGSVQSALRKMEERAPSRSTFPDQYWTGIPKEAVVIDFVGRDFQTNRGLYRTNSGHVISPAPSLNHYTGPITHPMPIELTHPELPKNCLI